MIGELRGNILTRLKRAIVDLSQSFSDRLTTTLHASPRFRNNQFLSVPPHHEAAAVAKTAPPAGEVSVFVPAGAAAVPARGLGPHCRGRGEMDPTAAVGERWTRLPRSRRDGPDCRGRGELDPTAAIGER